MKQALETRKANVEAINNLLSEFRSEGDLTTTDFPTEVRDKIERLNVDWRFIIQYAARLKERAPISEDVIVAEMYQREESAPIMAQPESFMLEGKISSKVEQETKAVDRRDQMY